MLGNNTGWICPHCNRANAPWMTFCCNGKNATTHTNPGPYVLPDTLQLCPHGSPIKFGSCFQCQSGVLKNASYP